MKKQLSKIKANELLKVISLFLFILIINSSYAQLKVLSDGRVGIGQSNPAEKLTINGNLRIEGTRNVIFNGTCNFNTTATSHHIVFRTGDVSRFHIYGSSYIISEIQHRFPNGSQSSPGICGKETNMRTTGIFWPANNTLAFSTNSLERMRIASDGNTAIGSTSTLSNARLYIIPATNNLAFSYAQNASQHNTHASIGYSNYSSTRHYAVGYNQYGTNFYVTTAGDVFCNSLTELSDLSYKENIIDLKDSFNSIEKLLQLRPVSFKYKNNVYVDDNDTVTYVIIPSDIKYGFVAQEVELILPNLVNTDENGIKGIHTTNIIPLLVEAIKIQQDRIKTLEEKLSLNDQKILKIEEKIINCCEEIGLNKSSHNNDLIELNEYNKEKNIHYIKQNTPNPFNTETKIICYIASNSSKSVIFVFDMQGSLKKTITNITQGLNEVIINAGEFAPGMYLYSLVVDGKEIDTKKMILTK